MIDIANNNPVIGSNRYWLCFSLDENENNAARIFRDRYKTDPGNIIEYSRMLWVGPIPKESE